MIFPYFVCQVLTNYWIIYHRMSSDTQGKLDRLITLLEAQELLRLKRPCNKTMFRDVILHTMLASAVGYFMFKILDHHLGPRRV